MKKVNQNLVVIVLTALFLAVVFYVLSLHTHSVPRFNFHLGQVSPINIQAPFAFDVRKSAATLEAEVSAEMRGNPPLYFIDENKKFDVLRSLDVFLLEELGQFSVSEDSFFVSGSLGNRSFDIESSFFQYLISESNRRELYNFLRVNLEQVLSRPIVNDNDKDRVIFISDEGRATSSFGGSVVALSDARSSILNLVPSSIPRYVVSEMLDLFLSSNLAPDTKAEELEREKIKQRLNPVLSRVRENEYILVKNDVITLEHIQKLESYTRELQERQKDNFYSRLFLSFFGQFLYNLLLLSLFYYLTKYFYRARYLSFKQIVMTYVGFILVVCLTVFFHTILNIPYIMLIPIPMIALIVALICSPGYGIMFGFFAICIVGQYVDWEMLPLISLSISYIICMIMLQKTKQTNYLLLFLYLVLGLVGTSILMAIYRIDDLNRLFLNIVFSLINASVSVIGAFIIVPILERKLEVATHDVLLHLIDYNNPLLKRLAKEAQGTYYHSLIVGNLAEECAEAIRANPMIARVGSYYHDIGKLEQPDFFIENQRGKNLHDSITPLESASVIKNHIKNGVVLARKARLPKEIVEIIQQHHGDSKIRYFLHKATEEGIEFDQNDFMYSGPKPKTKEATIVMIADIVESTAKASKDQSEVAIKKIIDDSINHLLADEQLNESPVTIKELATIKKTILPILCSIYRKRIEYPDSAGAV